MVRSRFRSRKFLVFAAVVLCPQFGPARVQTARPNRPGEFTEVKWDTYTFRFFKGNQMGQVLDADGHVLASIPSMNGGLQLLPSLTGVEADKLKKSFEDWEGQGGEKALNSASPQSARSSAAQNSTSSTTSATRGTAAAARPHDDPPTYRKSPSGAITGVNFAGEIAKVTLAKSTNGEAIGILFDNHSLPPQ
jgi:hypothetical protein